MKFAGKLVLEFIPLVLFLIFTFTNDVYVGTAWLMGTTVVATIAVWKIYKKVALMALINAVTGLISGGMTLYFTDPTYVKMKPTIISLIYAVILYVGVFSNRPLLKTLIGEELHLTDQGWRVITGHCALYFTFIAILNEVIWRTHTTEFWAGFKVFGLIPLSIIFGLAMIPLARRYRHPDAPHDSTVEAIAGYLEGKTARSAPRTVPQPSAKPVGAERPGS